MTATPSTQPSVTPAGGTDSPVTGSERPNADSSAARPRDTATPSTAPASLGLARANPVTVPSQVTMSSSVPPQYQREWLGQYR